MLVVSVISDRKLRVVHYTAQEGRDSLDGLPLSCKNVSLAGAASLTAAVSSPFTLAEIKEEDYPIDLAVDNIEILTYSYGVAKYTGTNAVERARSKVGETKYNIFFNNCETFVNWTITDENLSNQGVAAIIGAGAAVAVSIGVIGAAVYGLGTMLGFFGGTNKKK